MLCGYYVRHEIDYAIKAQAQQAADPNAGNWRVGDYCNFRGLFYHLLQEIRKADLPKHTYLRWDTLAGSLLFDELVLIKLDRWIRENCPDEIIKSAAMATLLDIKEDIRQQIRKEVDGNGEDLTSPPLNPLFSNIAGAPQADATTSGNPGVIKFERRNGKSRSIEEFDEAGARGGQK